jgi:hypothetical protein
VCREDDHAHVLLYIMGRMANNMMRTENRAAQQVFIATQLNDPNTHCSDYWARCFHFTGLHMLQFVSQYAAQLTFALITWPSIIVRCNEVFLWYSQQRFDSVIITWDKCLHHSSLTIYWYQGQSGVLVLPPSSAPSHVVANMLLRVHCHFSRGQLQQQADAANANTATVV